ncbi:MAG: glycosyltransferase family 2 protein, partial [Planctomycetota bacterium]
CWQMAQTARGQWLLFTDADVRFAPDAVGRALAAAQRGDAALISTFPREITGSLAEAALVPLIHFILFSYLPMPRMRRSDDPAASAGCGQFLLVRRDAYEAVGGHAAVRRSMHEGIKLPRLVRAAGFRSDLFDGTDLLECRMYDGLRSTWSGFAKNAFEGLGSIWLLLAVTAMHLVGHVLPWACVALALVGSGSARRAAPAAIAAIAMALLQRTLLARRFRQAAIGVVLHPIGVLAMTTIQWQSLLQSRAGRRRWRGREAGGLSEPVA